MNNLITVFFYMALINNLILVKFLGLCPFFGVSKKTSNALRMGLAVTTVMFVASIVTWGIYNLILDPLSVQFLKTMLFILVIASLVQIIELTIRRTSINLYNSFGIYLPLITTNCAILGLALINIQESYSFLETIFSALGAGFGFTLVLLLMSGIRERLDLADVPKSFEGLPIAFITAALLAMSFLAFGGMV